MCIHLTCKYYLVMVILLISTALFCQTVAEPPANYAVGDAGSVANPYQIATLGNLRWLSERGNNYTPWSKHYLQVADIDASETASWNSGGGFLGIGRNTDFSGISPFYGSYDGNGYTISNLFLDITNLYGIFDCFDRSALFNITDGAVIQNVRLENIQVFMTDLPDTYELLETFGGLVGVTYNTTISNCSVSGEIFIGDILPPWAVGGLVGRLSVNSTMSNCYYYGDIISDTENISYGGLVGLIERSNIEYCYLASRTEFLNINNVFGSIGRYISQQSSITNILWDSTSTGITELYGAIAEMNSIIENNLGLNTREMKQAHNYINNGWDFVNIWGIDADINDGYPYFLSEPYLLPMPVTLIAPENEAENIPLDITLQWEAGDGATLGYALFLGVVIPPPLVAITEDCLYTVSSLEPETRYYIQIVPYNDFGNASYCPVWSFTTQRGSHDSDIIINNIKNELVGNYPNPFNPETTISFNVARAGNVAIDVLNIKGQKITSIADKFYDVGSHTVVWNGTDSAGRDVSSGVYFYKMQTADFISTKKMLLLK